MYRIPSPPIYRRPPDDLDPDLPPTKHRRPPSPEASISRIFYKSGPLGKRRRNMPVSQKVKGTWITREMSYIGDNNEQQVRASLTEFAIFTVFLLVLMFVFFEMHPASQYKLTRVMRKSFIQKYFYSNDILLTFPEIASIAHMYHWIERVFIPLAYMDTWYRDQRLLVTTSNEDTLMLYENKVLSLIRIQALSVMPSSCKIFPAVKNYFNKCFGYYSRNILDDRREFGTAIRLENTRNEPYDLARGILANYPPIGSLIELSTIRLQAMSDIMSLRNSLWIARGVRAVVVHYNIYNVNVNCFCFMKFIFEAPPTGGIITSWNIHTTKILKYVDPFDFFILGLEFGLIIFITIFAMEEVREIMFFQWNFFYFFWNWVDVCLILFTIGILIIVLLQALSFPNTVVSNLEQSDTYYVSYYELSRYNSIYEILSSFVLFLAWFKVFKYMTFTKKMENVVKTLNQTFVKLFDYGLLSFIYFSAFLLWGFFLFHSAFEEYSTFFLTFISLMRMCDGDFHFDALRREDWLFGPIFIITYITLFFFILANVIVAIINEAYQIIRENESFKPTEVSPLHFLNRAYYNLFCGCKKKVEVYRKQHRRARMTFNEMQSILRSMNFTQEEILMFFAKYNIDMFRKRIPVNKLEDIINDLEMRGFTPSLPHDVRRFIRMREKRNLQETARRKYRDKRHYHVFTIAQYELLQTQLDQIEILLEMSCARLYQILKVLEVGVKYNWVQRTPLNIYQ